MKKSVRDKVRKQRVRAFLFDNLRKTLHIQRLNVSGIRETLVSHNRSRVRVYQHNLVAQLSQSDFCEAKCR